LIVSPRSIIRRHSLRVKGAIESLSHTHYYKRASEYMITPDAPTNAELTAIATACGIRLCNLAYEASKEAISGFVDDLISDSWILAQYASRSTILASDVIYALKISADKVTNQLGDYYGSDNEISDSEEDSEISYVPSMDTEEIEESELSEESSSSGASEDSIYKEATSKEVVELDGFSINSSSTMITAAPTADSPISYASIADIVNVWCHKKSLVIRIDFKALQVLKNVVCHHLARSYSGQLR